MFGHPTRTFKRFPAILEPSLIPGATIWRSYSFSISPHNAGFHDCGRNPRIARMHRDTCYLEPLSASVVCCAALHRTSSPRGTIHQPCCGIVGRHWTGQMFALRLRVALHRWSRVHQGPAVPLKQQRQLVMRLAPPPALPRTQPGVPSGSCRCKFCRVLSRLECRRLRAPRPETSPPRTPPLSYSHEGGRRRGLRGCAEEGEKAASAAAAWRVPCAPPPGAGER